MCFCLSSSFILPPYTLFFLNIRSMAVEAVEMEHAVAFLDCEVLSNSLREHEYSVSFMKRTFVKYAKKNVIISAYNSDGHWIAVLILPLQHKVLYLNSLKSLKTNLSMLSKVIDE